MSLIVKPAVCLVLLLFGVRRRSKEEIGVVIEAQLIPSGWM